MAGMDGTYPGKRAARDVWGTTATREVIPGFAGRAYQGPHLALDTMRDSADELYACEAFAPISKVRQRDDAAEPYSLQWFLDIEAQRHSREGRWIPRLLEFAKHSGETLLGLGSGLGTDWLQYARHGSSVVVCSPASEQLALIRRNFELRGLTGRFLHAQPTCLPLENGAIDVVCLGSLLDPVVEPQDLVEEIYRVLKPGGKVLALASARYDVDFWSQVCSPWQWWSPTRRAEGEGPRFKRRELKRLFGRFVEHRIHKRHLRRSHVPHLWRWLPRSFLERTMGRVLVLKAFKPLSAAIAVSLAA